jgi:hypothetical protein
LSSVAFALPWLGEFCMSTQKNPKQKKKQSPKCNSSFFSFVPKTLLFIFNKLRKEERERGKGKGEKERGKGKGKGKGKTNKTNK